MIALDPDTGQLKCYFQTLPHDTWDFDYAVGEFVQIDEDGQKHIVHPNKGGYVYVFDDNAGSRTPGRWSRTSTSSRAWIKSGKLIGRRDLAAGKTTNLCPAIAGGISWNTGTYNPKTGLYYKVGEEWCMDLEVVKTTRSPSPWRSSTSARTSR